MWYLASSDDETIWRGPNIRKGKAGDECQSGLVRRLKNLNVNRWDDSGRFHLVLEMPIIDLEADRVAQSNISQWAKECVPVAGEGDIARFTRKGCLGDMADRMPQYTVRHAFGDDDFQAEARNFHLAENTTLADNGRRHSRSSVHKACLFDRLIQVALYDRCGNVDQCESATC